MTELPSRGRRLDRSAVVRPPWPVGAPATGASSGRGLAYAAALELALKLKEACYLHAMGLSYADLLHGPIAVVDAEHPGHHRWPPTPAQALAGTIELARPGDQRPAPRAYAIGGGPGLAAACSRRAARPAACPSGWPRSA